MSPNASSRSADSFSSSLSQPFATVSVIPPFGSNAHPRPLRRKVMPTKTAPKKSAAKNPAPKNPANAKAAKAEPEPREGLNVAVVRGVVSSPPERRVLPSDTVLVQLQVTTRLASETLSMPVSCWNPEGWVEALEPGDEIVVMGRVRRRFFRAGGATASRVELEADLVVRATDRRRVRVAVRRVLAALEPLDG
jgi:single-strand DNA-binding protein